MIEKIIHFWKQLFQREKVLQIEATKDTKIRNGFREGIKNEVNDRIKLLNLQREIKNGKITEENLSKEEVSLLKQLYCEQILELAHSIEYYTKKVNG